MKTHNHAKTEIEHLFYCHSLEGIFHPRQALWSRHVTQSLWPTLTSFALWKRVSTLNDVRKGLTPSAGSPPQSLLLKQLRPQPFRPVILLRLLFKGARPQGRLEGTLKRPISPHCWPVPDRQGGLLPLPPLLSFPRVSAQPPGGRGGTSSSMFLIERGSEPEITTSVILRGRTGLQALEETAHILIRCSQSPGSRGLYVAVASSQSLGSTEDVFDHSVGKQGLHFNWQ